MKNYIYQFKKELKFFVGVSSQIGTNSQAEPSKDAMPQYASSYIINKNPEEDENKIEKFKKILATNPIDLGKNLKDVLIL